MMDTDMSRGDFRPYATEEDVTELMSRLYGMKVLSIKKLNGYDDQNFHVKVDEYHTNSNISAVCVDGYVLKILNTRDSTENQDHLRAQIGLLEHISKSGIVCPKHVTDVDGNMFTEQWIPDKCRSEKKCHVVRLLEYIDGPIMASVTLTDELTVEGGEYLAKFRLAIKDFDDKRLANDDYLWNLKNIPKLEPYISALNDSEKTATCKMIISEWNKMEPKLETLTYGPVHSDFNEQNLIVSRSPCGSHHVKGILDFQDSSYGYKVFDIAVYMMYMMVYDSDKDPIHVGGLCLAGYLKHETLSQEELDVLYYCVIGRFAQSLVIGAYYYSLHKDPYLIITQKPGWKVLKQLLSRSSQDTIKMWLEDAKSISLC